MSGRGGARAGAGRKKGGHNAAGSKAQCTGRIVISCRESEEAMIKAMAKEAGLSISSLILNAVLPKEDAPYPSQEAGG